MDMSFANQALGAEYMVHSFGSNGQMFFTEDYLVVEVALYPFQDFSRLMGFDGVTEFDNKYGEK